MVWGSGGGAGGTGGGRRALSATGRTREARARCLGGRGECGACFGGRGRLGRTLVGRWWSRYGAHAGCSTVGRPAEHRRLRPREGVLVQGLDMGGLRGTGGSSRTWWLLGLVLVWNMMAWGWHVHANAS